MTDVGPAAILPVEGKKLPREKRIPETKNETKWEKYAKERRITKRKRDRLEWSETEQKYIPAWGYQSAKCEIEEKGFVELKRGQDRDFDPNFVGEMNIKLNKRLNEGLHARLKDGIDDIRNDNSSLIRNLLIDPSAVNKKNKTRARIALKTVQQSTASMGRFDEMRKGEIASKSISKRQRLRCNTQTNKDKIAMNSAIRQIEKKEAHRMRGVANNKNSYEGFIPDAPEGRWKKR